MVHKLDVGLGTYFLSSSKLGSVDILAKPDESTGKIDKTQIVLCQFIKARENATKMFDLIDETFHEMSLAV